MQRGRTVMRITVGLIALLAINGSHDRNPGPAVAEQPAPAVRRVEFRLQTRDPRTGALSVRRQSLDPTRVGIVLVDTWNFHWCMTAAQRCGSFAPRFNKALSCARQLGMQVFWCPTDVADWYVGTPQRERAVAVPLVRLPPPIPMNFAPIACFQGNHCMCGPGIQCLGNYGWNAMNPALKIEENDLIPEGTEQLYSLCKQRGIETLIYFGFHTNVCTVGKSIGINHMAPTGLQCILARDMTDAITGYDPASNHHPDRGTEDVIAQIERQVPTVHMVDELRKLGLWHEDWVVDPVRITPWGTPERPYLFEESTEVALSAPLDPGCQIRYTLDGRPPGPTSARYTRPLLVRDTTVLRATAFYSDGRQACLESKAYLVRLPKKPPQPDVVLSDLKPRRATVFRFHEEYNPEKLPVMDHSYAGGPLKLREVIYPRGIGVYAPAQLVYDLKPQYKQFVALAGVDETIRDDQNGRCEAIQPSVVFKVFIDGRQVSQSPMMRILSEPWRFNIEIPAGSRMISLVATDGGNGNRLDLANWVNAGFVTKGSATSKR